MKKNIVSANSSYTFFDYFKMNADFEEIVAFWNFGFQIDTIRLPRSVQEIAEKKTNAYSAVEEILR